MAPRRAGRVRAGRSGPTRQREGRASGGGPVHAPRLSAGGAFAMPCTLCGHGGRGEARVRFLPHGVYVWLCSVHGSLTFISRDYGREFARRLQQRWQSSGVFGTRRRQALIAHVERLRRVGGDADKPGSHSWPKLRREAGRRFAAGDDPATVIAELRLDVSGGPAVAPSIRTFRRWFAQGRWLVPPPPDETADPTPAAQQTAEQFTVLGEIHPDQRE